MIVGKVITEESLASDARLVTDTASLGQVRPGSILIEQPNGDIVCVSAPGACILRTNRTSWMIVHARTCERAFLHKVTRILPGNGAPDHCAPGQEHIADARRGPCHE